METIMNHEMQDQDDLLIDLGAVSTETLGSVQPNAPDGLSGFLINGGIADE
jgi:hypothetical protein